MRSLIGKEAPKFKAKAVINGNQIVDDFSLEQYLGKKYVVFFSDRSGKRVSYDYNLVKTMTGI